MPCDDTYQDEATRREVSFPTTSCRHFEMPFAFDSPDQVRGLPGVGRPKFSGPPTPRKEACSRKAAHLFPGQGGGLIAPWWKAYQRCVEEAG
jgi:hypothetical protein